MQRWATRRVVIAGTAGLVAALLLALVGLYVIQRDRTLPNTAVAGVDVGRMTADEVRSALAPLVSSRHDDPIELTFEDETFALIPAEVGYAVDLDATVAAALARGRSGGIGEVATRIRSLRATENIAIRDDHDRDAIETWVEEVADEVDRDVSPGVVEPDPDTLSVEVELPHGSAAVRRDETVDLLLGVLATGSAPIELPVDTEPQRVPDEDVEEVAAQVERALEGDLELHADEESLTFSPRELATVIEVVERPRGEEATVELTVSADAVADVVGDVEDRFSTEPVDARFETSRTPPVSFDTQGSTSFTPVEAEVTVEPGQDGTRFDLDLLVDQLTELLRDGTRTAELELELIEPELTTARAEELAPTHLIGTFTTYHPAGQPRVVNIQLLADTVDNTLLLPGEQFSINEISGPRTCSAGYQPAGTIVAGELKDTCGGGTSQFGTTTFNAAFFSGLQLDQWKAHSWYFSRYPQGREATLSYPHLDVKFTNTTDAAVIVRTSHTPGSITVSIYGQPLANEVAARHSGRFAHRSFSEDVRKTEDRCEGDDEIIQEGAGGFSVDVVREIELTDGSTEREDIRTVYVPRTKIIEAGDRDCSPPEDEEDDADPAEEGDADDEA